MKKLCKLFALAALFFSAACEQKPVVPELLLDRIEDENIVLDQKGEERLIGFASTMPWVASVIEGAGWIELSETAGEAGSCVLAVKVGQNLDPFTRKGLIELFSAGKSIDIYVEQPSDFMEQFSLSEQNFEVPAEGGTIEVKVNTNVDYKFDILDDWITEVKAKALTERTHVLKIARNPSTEVRTGTVTFCANQQCIPVTVVQAGSENPGGSEEGGSGGGSVEGGGVADGNFVHRSLAMRFTADWCGYCPTMATSFELAYDKLEGMIELVSLHVSGGLVCNGLYPLANRFSIEGYPSGIIDTRAYVQNYSSDYASDMIKSVVEETRSSYPAKTGIAVSSTVSGSQVTVDVDVHVKEADEYTVSVFLLEDNIFAYQNGKGNNYEHDHVLRMSLTSISGDDMTVVEDNSVWSKTYSATIPSAYEISNMKVLVFVEKPYGSREKASGVYNVIYGDYGSTYVDNARSAALGTTVEVEYE